MRVFSFRQLLGDSAGWDGRARAHADDPKRPLAVNAAVQSEYARLTGISQAVLTAAMEPWLPIAAVRLFVLLGGPTSARWERIIQRVEAALRPED